VQFECHTAPCESYKLKEIRPFLAIMVADNETVCTEYPAHFSGPSAIVRMPAAFFCNRLSQTQSQGRQRESLDLNCPKITSSSRMSGGERA
jgi:hypothetical protein